MPRLFDGADDYIGTALGSGPGAGFYGTMAMLMRRPSDAPAALGTFIEIGQSAERASIQVTAGHALRARFATQVPAPTPAITLTPGEGWNLIAVTKDTGTVFPRYHRYLYSSGVWTHADSALGTANANPPTVGYNFGGGLAASVTKVELAVAAYWFGVAMTDAQVESLAHSMSAWWAVDPLALWVFDQDDPAQKLVDLSGGGANESSILGTAVGAVSSPLSYGQELMAA